MDIFTSGMFDLREVPVTAISCCDITHPRTQPPTNTATRHLDSYHVLCTISEYERLRCSCDHDGRTLGKVGDA